MSYNDQHQAPPIYPPPASYGPPPPEGYQEPPPPGYPAKAGMEYQQQPSGPVETQQRGDGFWKGCCAALCCCCVLEECF